MGQIPPVLEHAVHPSVTAEIARQITAERHAAAEAARRAARPATPRPPRRPPAALSLVARAIR